MKNFTLLTALLTVASLASGNQVSESQVQYIKQYEKQKQVTPAIEALVNTDAEPDLSHGFVALYNGKNLDSWTPRGGTCTFEAQGDVIIGTTVKDSPSTYLLTDKEDYTDFIFTAELKWEVDGNSGIMFRAQRKPGKEFDTVFGPQCEMEGFATGRGWSGGIYGQDAGGWRYPLWLDAHTEVRQALKADEWNRVTIQAHGDVIKTWVNGIPAAHLKSDEFMKGSFGLQVHSGKEGKILFRNIKVKELAPTELTDLFESDDFPQ